MRLICPNCDAQYEVDDSLIPAGGRDVQCSNCGHAWFQPGAGALHAGTGPQEAADEVAGPPAHEAEPEATEATEAAHAAEAEPGIRSESETDHTAATEDAARMAAPAEPQRRTLDDAVLSVLREEAEREARARREEGLAPIETQPDLGLAAGTAGAAPAVTPSPVQAPVPAAEEAQVAHFDETPDHLADETGEADGGQKGSRRALLPDIEEINSTLSATTGRSDDSELPPTAEVVAMRRSGFRRGFSIALLIMVLLLGTYALAPNIAARFPATEPALAAYVAKVDALRLWMDARMRSSTEALRGKEQQTN